MKKSAFTLAEILITLGIIGIVAAINKIWLEKMFYPFYNSYEIC